MRIPNRILEHPVEAAIAGLLLLALLFVSADPPISAQTQSVSQQSGSQQVADSQNM